MLASYDSPILKISVSQLISDTIERQKNKIFDMPLIINASKYVLPNKIHRRFLMLTDFWVGTRVSPDSLLVKLHNGNAALAPFFWVGTPADLPSCYSDVDAERSVYCFPGTFGVMPPTESTIKILAAYFVAEMLKLGHQQPFLLGGFCTAGLITYEAAKILTEQGYLIDLLVLCERDVSESNKVLNIFRNIYHYNEMFYRHMLEIKKDPGNWLNLISKKLNAFSPERAEKQSPESSELLYILSGYTGKVHLFYVKWGVLGFYNFQYFQKYWIPLAQGCTFHFIDGRLHSPPDWKTISEMVKKLIAKQV